MADMPTPQPVSDSDITVLFSRDPHGFSDQDLANIVGVYHQQYAAFQARPDARGLKPSRAKQPAKQPAKPALPTLKLDLS